VAFGPQDGPGPARGMPTEERFRAIVSGDLRLLSHSPRAWANALLSAWSVELRSKLSEAREPAPRQRWRPDALSSRQQPPTAPAQGHRDERADHPGGPG